ncbi:MAG: hypothetical protein GX070_11365 [Alcaligenaceae bacterium]|nr:hypothetical protein [Alcaligenaceae bacterium]
MKISRKLGLIVLPLAVALAGCAPMQKDGAADSTTQAPAQTQGASVDVYTASDKVVKGYRAFKLNEKQTIYVSQNPVVTRENLTTINHVKDNQGRTFIQLGLNPAGVEALSKVGNQYGFATTIGGQLASISGIRQGNNFLFMVRDDTTASSIMQAVVPQQAKK